VDRWPIQTLGVGGGVSAGLNRGESEHCDVILLSESYSRIAGFRCAWLLFKQLRHSLEGTPAVRYNFCRLADVLRGRTRIGSREALMAALKWPSNEVSHLVNEGRLTMGLRFERWIREVR
jgi:hypothetical protein